MPETTVYTTADLAAAIGAASEYDYIYLGADIQIGLLGMTIGANKTSLVIDGFHNNITHTLEDANSISDIGTIGIRSASNITVTFKNMVMTGRNYFGMPFVNEGADTSGVTVIYENVTYTGPQITFNPNGLTRYIDCNITIVYPTIPSLAQEVGEVNRVEFKGVNTITHTGTSDAVFWFRGTIGTAYLKVLQDADVTITTSNYFMYSRTPVIPTENNPVAYEIEPGASLTLTSNHGISFQSDHLASSFLVDTNASFTYIQETDNDSVDTLYLSGPFTVNEGARVYMQADFDTALPLINFVDGSDLMSINNPKSFVLYNRVSPVVTVGGSGVTQPFLLTGGQLNQWYNAGAGDLTDSPDRKWNRPSWNTFSMQGTLTQLSTDVNSTTFTPEELANLPDPDDLSFQDARVISIGNLPIVPDLAADDGRPIRGRTEPLANVKITYTVEGEDFSFETMSDMQGIFMVSPANPIPAGTLITIEANTPFLITEIETTVVAAVDEIILQRVPVDIAFRIPPISTSPYVLLGRVNPSEAVEVLDSRIVGTRWELLASVEEPLRAPSGETLENALVFKDTDGNIHELTATPIVVYEGGPVTGETIIIWPAENGILVRVTEPIRSGVEYSTELKWELNIIT